MFPSTVNSTTFLWLFSILQLHWCLESFHMYHVSIWTGGIIAAGHAAVRDPRRLLAQNISGAWLWGEGAGGALPIPGTLQAMFHICLWEMCLAPEQPDDSKSHLRERPRKAKGHLNWDMRQAYVLALPPLGSSMGWTLLELGVVAILVLFYIFSVFFFS